MRSILIQAGTVSAEATLEDTPTAEAVWKALPLEARGNTWGDEIYFGIPVDMDEEEGASDVVDMGDLGYWPPGHAFCIFFGPTPASRGKEIRAASPVNRLGRLTTDPRAFEKVLQGTPVRITRKEGAS